MSGTGSATELKEVGQVLLTPNEKQAVITSQVDPGSQQSSPVAASSTNPLVRLILNHYSKNVAKVKTAKEISSEKWLLPGNHIKFNRWMLMPAAVLTQFCVGSLYSFSVLNKPIEMHIYGEIRNIAPITFYIGCGSLGLCTGFMGPWIERKGIRAALLLGTLLFCSGQLLTALALYLKQMWLVFLAYGVIGGVGTGLCYIAPISCLQKWFPDRRGLASGVAISGFGAGSIAFAKILIILIKAMGLPMTFVGLGLVTFILLIVGTLILRTPPPDFCVTQTENSKGQIQVKNEDDILMDDEKSSQAPKKLTMTLVEAIQAKDFYLVLAAFMAGVIFGLCAMSRLSNMVTDIFRKDPNEASTVVSINGGFNVGGRIVIAIISDFLGRKNSFVLMLTIQLTVVGLFSVITTSGNYPAFVAAMWTSAMCYGGISAMIPAILTDLFGAGNVGACMGIQMTGWSFAGVGGGLIFTAVFDAILSSDGGYTSKDPYPYNVNSWWIAVIVFIGWVCLFFVQSTETDLMFWKRLKNCFGKNKTGRPPPPSSSRGGV